MRVEAPPSASPAAVSLPARTLTVVGVVRDPGRDFPGAYLPTAPESPETWLYLRVRGNPEQARLALLERLMGLDPAFGIMTVRSGMQATREGPEAQVDGQPFDTLASQIARNGDAGQPLLVKIDIEGAEWDSLMATHDDVPTRSCSCRWSCMAPARRRSSRSCGARSGRSALSPLNAPDAASMPDCQVAPGTTHR